MEEYSLTKGKNVNTKSLRKTFINYFSIGYEARAGFSFEKQRSKNRYINKCIYAYKGFQKFFKCCTRNYFLTDLIYSFQIGENTISCPFSKQKTFAFGKKILYQILFDAKEHLTLNGQLWLVVNKDQGAKSLLKDLNEVYDAKLVCKNKGFYIICAQI